MLVLQTIAMLSLNACLISTTFMLDKERPRTVSAPNFETGLIFEACERRGKLLRTGPQVIVREFLTRRIVFNDEVDWHTNTSIALDPGKYIVDFHVNYLSRQIWKYKGFFVVDEGAPTHLILETPLLVISKPKVIFR